MNSYEFAYFVLTFVHEICEKFVHEFMHEFVHKFMPEDYVFKEEIWGNVSVSVSLILPENFQCGVLSAWADIEICLYHQRQSPI